MKYSFSIKVFVLVILLVRCTDLTGQLTTSLSPSSRDVSELTIGFNRRSDPGNLWNNSSFINLVSEMNPDVVRYPAGTQANYWDWRTGQFIPGTDRTWGNKEILTIPTFLNALPDRTKVVYVVNMARPTPSTGVNVNASEVVLKSNTTLNLQINDMIAALQKFESEGKLPYAVELGNEFYFGNIESGKYQIVEDSNNGLFYSGWDEANNRPFESNSKPEATEVTALFYLNHCLAIVNAIKAVYPTMKFALTTTKEGFQSRVAWNSTIFNNLLNNSEFESLKQDIYAVTQHHYLNDSYGLQITISDETEAKIAIADGIQYPRDKQSDYDLVPSPYKIWITEYGEVKEIAEESWAAGLRYIAMVYGWLERGEKIEQLLWHYISDNNVINTSAQPMKLAPIGIVQKLLSRVVTGMTEMKTVNFSNNPTSINGVESLFGLKFKNNQKETVLIFNVNNQEFNNVQINDLFEYTDSKVLTKFYSDQPYVSPVKEGDQNIIEENQIISGDLTINPFSISILEVENTLSTETSNLNSISVFPNPFDSFITIRSKSPLLSIEIYNSLGQKVYLDQEPKDNRINLNVLSSGIYTIKSITHSGSQTFKIIKR